MRARSFLHVSLAVVAFAVACHLGARSAASQASESTAVGTEEQTFGRINVSAGIIYTNGDVKPAARIAMYLLDERARGYLERVGNAIPPKDLKRLRFGGTEPAGWALSGFRQCVRFERYNKKDAACAETVRESLLSCAIAATRTGFDGKAVLDSLPPAKYYVFAEITTQKVNRISGRFMDDPHFWFASVVVRGGPQELVLDNNSLW